MNRRSARSSEGVFVIEGEKILSDALGAGAEIESLFVASGVTVPTEVHDLLERAMASGVRVFELAPGVMERVADTVTPQPVLGVVRTPRACLRDLAGVDFVVVCVEVRDPGNAGAVIRAADAAGARGVVCCAGTVDPFNPKTVRASAGSVLHLPVVSGGDPAEVLDALGSYGLRRVAAVAHGGMAHTEAELSPPIALILGNEASGLGQHLFAHVDATVSVPMSGRAESLNVSMAAAVLCFEVARTRSNVPMMDRAR